MVLETRRVRLRQFTYSDLDVLAPMMADQEQMSLYPRPRTRDETKAWLDRNLDHYEKHGFGFWLMQSLAGADFLGYCGLRPPWWLRPGRTLTDAAGHDVSRRGDVEIGWHTKKHFWRQGLATEAAAACRDLAFARFDIPRLVATIDPKNGPSLRVADKIGMELESEAVLDGWTCLVYSVEPPHTKRRDSEHI